MKVHDAGDDRRIVAVSDSSLVGRVINDENLDIEITVSKEFYGEEQFGGEEVIRAIKDADNVNLMGNEIVELAIKEELLEESSVVSIGGIKHAQLYKL